MVETANILVVDDEPALCHMLSRVLQKVGYQVDTATSGAQALAKLGARSFDLALLDLHLGDMHGIALLRQVREQWPHMPIVLMTAHGSLTTALAAMPYDVSDYLLKPIPHDELYQRIGEVLATYRAKLQRQARIHAIQAQVQQLLNETKPPYAHEYSPGQPVVQEQVSGPLTIDLLRQQATLNGQLLQLTSAEFRILAELTAQPGSIISCIKLSRSFHGTAVSEAQARQIIRPHMLRLRRKIEVDPQHPRFLLSVRGLGYRWNGEG